MASIFQGPEAQEFDFVFGSVIDPAARAYDEQMLSVIRSRFTHEQIMAGQFEFPIGYPFGEVLAAAGRAIGKVIKAAAPFVAMIPGYGTVVGAAMYSAGSLAAGDRLDDSVIKTIEQVLPANIKGTYRKAVDIGYAIGRGQPVGKITVELARKTAGEEGGPTAQAAFDAGVSIGQGKGLQDAGFKLLHGWAEGATNDQRAAAFLVDLGEAAIEKKPIKQFLLEQGQKAFFKAVPAAQQAYMLKKAIDYFLAHPDEMVDPQTADIAERLGIPVEAIRAAIMCIREMADGTLAVDPNAVSSFDQFYGAYVVSTGTNSADILRTGLGLGESTANKARNNALALQGMKLAQLNPDVATLRASNTSEEWRRGFDVGTVASIGHSLPGPSQDSIRNSLITPVAIAGFDKAREQQYNLTNGVKPVNYPIKIAGRIKAQDIVRNADLARKGAIIAAGNPMLAALRAAVDDGGYRRGFDIGCAAAQGQSLNGPIKDEIRHSLEAIVGGSDSTVKGFDTACVAQYGITKAGQNGTPISGNPQFAAGQIVTMGAAGSGLSADQKGTAVGIAASASPVAQAGVASTLPHVEGFWAKVKKFFGL